MSTVSVIGTGAMGSAIGGVLTNGGATVDYIGNSETASIVAGDIVVLAVPYPAVEGILAQYGDQFAGKIVIDITNPLNFETFDSLTVADGSSATAVIAAELPNSRVLKAFNTTFAATLGSKTVGPVQTTVLIAGDDSDAKSTLAALVQAGGLAAVDAGSLARAHELEALGFLQLTLAASEKIAWTGGFGLVP
ncbi:NADPH-dependent F420 reductase [Leucobacter sp. USHLN154]|uniref:NADPH-dependent F420 reductase n=1 Tax=Leucobacter sp. USHLN154 TaxID=3081269 RepID=UPI00301754CF